MDALDQLAELIDEDDSPEALALQAINAKGAPLGALWPPSPLPRRCRAAKLPVAAAVVWLLLLRNCLRHLLPDPSSILLCKTLI